MDLHGHAHSFAADGHTHSFAADGHTHSFAANSSRRSTLLLHSVGGTSSGAGGEISADETHATLFDTRHHEVGRAAPLLSPAGDCFDDADDERQAEEGGDGEFGDGGGSYGDVNEEFDEGAAEDEDLHEDPRLDVW